MPDPNAAPESGPPASDPFKDWLNLNDFAEESDLDALHARTRADRRGSSGATAAFGSNYGSNYGSGLGSGSGLDFSAAAPFPAIPGYEIVELLGRGGMGVVFKAKHLALDRYVALKMIFAGGFAAPREVARLRAEAAAIAQLQHPNIVQIFEIGEHEGKPYLALEFVDGGSLDRQMNGLPQAPRGAAALVAVLARTMQAAHEKGIIHRDLKPANVLLASKPGGNPGGKNSPGPQHATSFILAHVPKITDFGLAKSGEGSGATETGEALGTPSYMAPEQASGKNERIGPAVDIYSLGAVLYEMLTGRPPFRGVSPLDTMMQVQTAEPVPPRRLQPKLPIDLEVICLKCLRKEPGARYATALALAEDLRRFLYGIEIEARPVGRLEKAWKWLRRNPGWAAAAALAFLLAVSLAGGGWWLRREELLRKEASLSHVRQTMSAAQLLRREARRNNDLAKWREAETLARRAFAAAETAELDQDHVKDASILWHETAAERKELEQQLADARADEKMLARLNEVQALKTTIARGRFITEEAIPGYENAFKEYGCDPKANSAVAVARMLQGRAIAPELAAALDDWASLLKPEAEALRTKLRQAARRIDPDPFRTQLRDLLESRSREGLRLLVGAPEALSQPALSQVRLAQAVRAAGDLDLAVTFLRKAQEQRPSDFWLNFYLGLYLLHQNRPDEAARYFTVAVALQPRSPGAWFALGLSLGNQSKHEEAAQAYQRALKLKADYAEALGNLALLHADLGRLDQAIPLIKQVTILDPENPQGHANLGELLSQDGQHEAALAAFKAGLLRSGTNALWAGNLKERIGQTERKLALAKKLPPRGSAALDWKAADLEAAAELCMDLRRFGQAADLCALLPPNRERRLGGPLGEARLLAITAAAKAGTGETRDQPPLADADRKTYRRLALAWLTQDLAKLRTQAQSGTPADAAIAREALRRLQNHFDLAPLRGEPLQKLPEDEQAAWRKFWTDLADLRRQSQD